MNPKYLFIVMTLLGSAFLAGCPGKNNPASPSNSPSSQATPIESNSMAITATLGGSVTLTDGTNVVIPANTLSQSTTVTISKYNSLNAPTSIQSFTGLPYAYKFDSGSATFTGSVTITLPYSLSEITGGATENDLVAEYYDGTEWVITGGVVDTVNHVVNVPTNHFSFWQVAWDNINPGGTTASSASLNVPYYMQETAFWCNATATSMLLRYYNNNSENCDIAAFFNQSSDGSFYNLVNAPNILGEFDYVTSQKINSFPDFWGTNSSNLIPFLKKSLSHGYPVLVNDLGLAHSFVAVGFDSTYIYVNDPSGLFYQTALKTSSLGPGNNFANVGVTPSQFMSAVTALTTTLEITNKPAGGKTGSIEIPSFHSPDEPVSMVTNANNPSDYLDYVWDGHTHPNGYFYNANIPADRSSTVPSLGYDFTNQDKLNIKVYLTNITTSSRTFGVTVHFINTDNNQTYQGTSSSTFTANSWNTYQVTVSVNTLVGFIPGNYNLVVDLLDNGVVTDTTIKKFYLAISMVSVLSGHMFSEGQAW